MLLANVIICNCLTRKYTQNSTTNRKMALTLLSFIHLTLYNMGDAPDNLQQSSNITTKDGDLTPQLRIHYENEAEILKLLLDLETRYRDYYKIYLCEIETQKIIIERIWLLSQRYLILISSAPSCRFPEVYTLSAEEVIVNEYEEKLSVLLSSNKSLKRAVVELNDNCKKFYEAYNRLDKTMDTPFILGDKFHRSIKHHKAMVYDIWNYFFSSVLKLKCSMHQLDPVNLESVEDYRLELKHSEEFEEYLIKRFIYCKCLQPRPTCPVEKLKCLHPRLDNLKHIGRL